MEPDHQQGNVPHLDQYPESLPFRQFRHPDDSEEEHLFGNPRGDDDLGAKYVDGEGEDDVIITPSDFLPNNSAIEPSNQIEK